MILNCMCAHPFQDRLYGPGRRVHNLCPKNSGDPQGRCTVCETLHFKSQSGFAGPFLISKKETGSKKESGKKKKK